MFLSNQINKLKQRNNAKQNIQIIQNNDSNYKSNYINNQGKRLFAIVLFCLLVLALLFPANLYAASDNEIERIYGDNRMETMYQIALKLSPGLVNNVVLASGYGFADALAGVPFAHQKYAPILLVDEVPRTDSKAMQYVKEHLRVSGKVYILGGTSVITSECEKVLNTLGVKKENIIRIAGNNRYETAVKIAQNMVHTGSEYYLVSGVNFPDALSASVLAAATNYYTAEEADYWKSKGRTVQASRGGVPIILLPSDGTIPDSVCQYFNEPLQDQASKQILHIIGGTGAIPEKAVTALKTTLTQLAAGGVERISGRDRYETNKNLILQQNTFDKSWQSSGQSLPIPQLVLAYGQDYPDALTGAVLAASMKAPLVLINKNLPAAASDILLSYHRQNLAAQKASAQSTAGQKSVGRTSPTQVINTRITILGGTGVVSQDTVTAVDYLYNYGKAPGGSKVSTFAGSGQVGSKNGFKLSADFCFPYAAVQAANGSIYVADTNNNLIRLIRPNGAVSTYAGVIKSFDDYGLPESGFINGKAAQARFNGPRGLALDSKGSLYVADSGNGAVRIITPQGVVSTLVEGLSLPTDLIFSKNGTLYVTETMKHRVLEVKLDGTYTVVAGGNYQAQDGLLEGALADGHGEEAKFNEPTGLALRADGTIYVADSGNQRIRAISPDKNVTTLAGSGTEKMAGTTYLSGRLIDGNSQSAAFNFPAGITVDSNGKIYVADSYNHAIRVITDGQVSTLTGKGLPGKQNGYLEQAQFDGPTYLKFLNNGQLLVVDQLNHQLKVIEFR